MDVTAVDKVETTLTSMDKAVQEVTLQITELGKRQQEEVTKIDKYETSSKVSLSSAAEMLRLQVGRQFSLVAEELMSQKEELEATKSELVELLDMAERGHLGQEEICLLDLADKVVPELQTPVLHLVKSHSKLKASDVGYIQIAEFLPHEFRLNLVRVGLCTVTTNQHFTDRVQSSIKFNVKNKASKVPITFLKEECGLADDRKSFRMAFSAIQQGEYVVSVLLYDQHVFNSPIKFTVPADNDDGYGVGKIPEKISSSIENRTSDENTLPHHADVLNEGLPESKTNNEITTQGTTCVDVKKSEPIDSGIETLADGIRKLDIEANCNIPSQPSKLRLSEMSGPVGDFRAESNNNYLLLDKPPQSPVLDKGLRRPLSAGLQSIALDFVSLADRGKLLWVRKASVGTGPASESGGRILPTLNKPIGICLLQNKTIVVASTGEHQVKLFSPAGKLMGHVTPPERTFFRPSDLASLKSGQFVVRDNGRVQVFSPSGEHVRTLVQLQPRSDCSCYGLAEDGEGRLVTIQQATRGEKATDLLFFDTISGELVKKISMEDVIKDKQASKCRFLTFSKDKLYITDLGLDCVYTLDPRNGTATVFGKSGTGPSCFSDPAGLVVDEMGNTVVADSKNHRLCLYTSQGKFHSEVQLSPEVRRPSGLLMDLSAKEMYVLNLHGREAMVKYALGK